MPAVGSSKTNTSAPCSQPLGDHDLLLVAARQRAARRRRRRRALIASRSIMSRPTARSRSALGRRRRRQPGGSGLAQRRQRDVLADAEVHHVALRPAVLGEQRDPGGHRRLGACACRPPAPCTVDRAAGCGGRRRRRPAPARCARRRPARRGRAPRPRTRTSQVHAAQRRRRDVEPRRRRSARRPALLPRPPRSIAALRVLRSPVMRGDQRPSVEVAGRPRRRRPSRCA